MDKSFKRQEKKLNFKGNFSICIKIFTILYFLCCNCRQLRSEDLQDNLICHFDFKNAANKKVIFDTTNRHKCFSRTCNFVIQDNALRIDSGAQICIPTSSFPYIDKNFTIACWIVKGRFDDIAPLFFKGVHPEPLQFLFGIKAELPFFVFKNLNRQNRWKGIVASGTAYAKNFIYKTPTKTVGKEKPNIYSGFWYHLAVVFDKGNIKIYKNGQLTIVHESAQQEILKNNNFPIYIGAERLLGTNINYLSANILINDIRIYRASVSGLLVKNIYESEKDKYLNKSSFLTPSAYLLAPKIYSLPVCNTYQEAMFKDYDPEFKKKLKITQEYDKKLAQNPMLPFENIKSSKLMRKNGQIGLFINGKQNYPFLAIPFICKDNKFFLNSMKNYLRDFAAAQVNLVSTGSVAPIPSFCIDEGKYDWKVFDSVFESVLDANPQAQIMPNIFLRPPLWFIRKYPDEIEKYYVANQIKPFINAAPLGSEKWLSLSKQMLKDIIEHIEKSKYSNHVYAYMLSCGDAGEWYWSGSFTGGMPGYSKATQESFQKWLREKYKSQDNLLKKAWNDNHVNFDTAEVPSPSHREKTEHFIFRDPAKSAPVFDFRAYMNDITMKNINESCKVIKEASGYKKLVNIYYGYTLLYVGGKNATLYKGGLQNLSKVMKSPYIDGIATPIDYGKRRGSESGLNINPFYASAKLHNKLIWQENDLRTYLHDKPEFGRTENIEETNAVIERAFGMSLTNGAGFWFLTFNNAWYHQNDIMNNIAKIQKAGIKSLDTTGKGSVSEIAIIHDEKSFNYTGIFNDGNFLDDHCWGLYQEITRCGVPFDMFLLDDLENPDMPDYKLYIFLNTFYSEQKIRDIIKNKLKRNNAIAVWCYAPGYITEKKYDVEAMYKLTGIKLAEDARLNTISLKTSSDKNVITKYLKTKTYTFGPSFYITDRNVEILGTDDEGKGIYGLKKLQNYTSIYTLMPLNRGMLMGLLEYAGIHVYCKSGDVFMANKSYIMLHTSSAGIKTINLPGKYNVEEILTGEKLGQGISTFAEKLPAQRTRIYRLIKSE